MEARARAWNFMMRKYENAGEKKSIIEQDRPLLYWPGAKCGLPSMRAKCMRDSIFILQHLRHFGTVYQREIIIDLGYHQAKAIVFALGEGRQGRHLLSGQELQMWISFNRSEFP